MKTLIDPYRTIAIIGMAKNTGKTTTLNAIIEASSGSIAVTSIGLDGEAIDQTTFLPKPKITIKKDMVIATAKSCLTTATFTYQTLQTTALTTALGPIVIIKASTKGSIVIAGPTTNREMGRLIQTLKTYAKTILIDGAFNRMTFANLVQIEAIILATGASLSKDMDETILKTKELTTLFTLSKHPSFKPSKTSAIEVKTLSNHHQVPTKSHEAFNHMLQYIKNSPGILYVKGAFTGRHIKTLIQHRVHPIDLVLDDATKYLITYKERAFLKALNITPYILHPINLIAVTINPTSPFGWDYPPERFLSTLDATLDCPVLNVMRKV